MPCMKLNLVQVYEVNQIYEMIYCIMFIIENVCVVIHDLKSNTFVENH